MLSFIFGRQTEAEAESWWVVLMAKRGVVLSKDAVHQTGFAFTSLCLQVFVVAVFFPRGFPLTELSKHFDHDCQIILSFRDHTPDKRVE